MKWRETRKNRLESELGHTIETTTFQGRVRWCATSPTKTLIAITGSKQDAIDACNRQAQETTP